MQDFYSTDLEKLDWDKLLGFLERFLFSEKAKEKIKKFPLSLSFEEARKNQEKTRFTWELLEKGHTFSFPSLKNLSNIFEKAEKRGFFILQELFFLKDWFYAWKSLKNLASDSPFKDFLSYFEEVEEIEDFLKSKIDFKSFFIKDRASFELLHLRRKIRELEGFLREKLEKLREFYLKKGYLMEPIVTQRNGRYVFPVKIEFKNKIKGILHEVSSSGATAFIEPASIIPLSNDLEELKWKEEREERKILKEIYETIKEFKETFLKLEEIFVDFEFALAKAGLGRTYRGIFPELVDTGAIEIYNTVNPLLYLLEVRPLVFNDLIVKKGLLISGPNMGGKTVTLKTIGLLCAMAREGFLIPGEKAKIPVFNKIFVDLGDEQNLLEGESSFSSHLKNLKKIIEKADSKTLVLLDEPGKGTNPQEGSAIVCAIIEELLKRNTKVVVTTHSEELKLFALKLKEMEIASMEFDTRRMTPLYKLVYNTLGASFAFELAKKVGIPENLLKRAEEFLTNKEIKEFERILKEEKRTLEEKEKRLKSLERKLAEEKEKLEKLKENLRRTFEKEKKEFFEKYVRKFEEIFKEIEKKREKEVKKLKRLFQENLREALTGEILKEKREIKEGDRVFVKSLNTLGEVVKIKEKRVIVQVGALKIEVVKEDLTFPEESEVLKSVSSGSLNLKHKTFKPRGLPSASLREKIDVRGLSSFEAINEIEKFLNESFLKGVKEVLIVHGHGTGKLREEIRKYLEGHPLVEKFEYAPPHLGGTGATLVKIATLI